MEALPTYLQATAAEKLGRLNSGLRGGGKHLDLRISAFEDETHYYLTFQGVEEKGTLVIPRPHRDENGNEVLGDQNHRRVLCPFMIVDSGEPQHVSYDQLVSVLLSENIEEMFPAQGKRNLFDKILHGFLKDRGRLAIGMCQRFLNLVLFNALPLTGTPMQNWAMNRRLMIFDPAFDSLRPDDKLEYQKRKNELLFPWSSIGLSDGAAATKNYILKDDLKKYTAFGTRHHNPIRNLYSTLGMKGDEPADVISSSMSKLENQGIVRGGWNWMTVFLDVPENFEDQILVDKRHEGKQVTYKRSFTIFGEETVMVGDTILRGRVLGINSDESPVFFDIDCDHAKVVEIRSSVVPFDGLDEPIRLITIEAAYSFREGIKITNQHGNKGIVALRDLGTIDIAGELLPIDVIVSAKSVQKRNNFGQILEAMTGLITPRGVRTIVPDNIKVEIADVEQSLLRQGLPADGAFDVETPWGNFHSIAGWVHWGVTKTPEEQLWEKKDVLSTNQRGLRTKGNKISTVELKALTTLFGPGSNVVKEILSHRQGMDEVRELIGVLECLRGNYNDNLPLIDADSFVYLPSGMGTFHDESRLVGTVGDEELYPNGCYLQLPFTLQVRIPLDRFKNPIQDTIASRNAYDNEECRVFETDRLMMPGIKLRQPWKHPTGKYGLSDISTLLNQVLEAIDRLKHGEIKEEIVSTLVYRYYHHITRGLATKSGRVSQLLMSVRYPWSSKATAALKSSLPTNHIEVHSDMASDIKVEDGDYVIVERFPCLGFMSTRIQRVVVTDDPQCKYVIRVSGNSLVSMNLDFDGDVIYVMSFHTEGAQKELRENFHNPHPRIKQVLDELNGRKVPITRDMTLQEMGVKSFDSQTPAEHAEMNGRSLAVKLWTGPVIALCYNLMRIVEGSIPYTDREGHINIEVFLDKVGNSVFAQKHGTRSLREECVEAVCLANAKAMVELGFPIRESLQLCNIIRERAAMLGVRTDAELLSHYQKHVEEGRSNILNAIVRRFHKSYFATRSLLHPVDFLEHLETEPSDLVGHLIHQSLQEVDSEDMEMTTV